MLENRVPETDAEVLKKLAEMYDHKGIVSCMQGIFRCRRAQGESTLQAYENTLKDYLKNTDKNITTNLPLPR